MGIKSVLVTGDNPGSAASVAAALGIDEFHAQVLPDDKARVIRDLKIRRPASSRWPATASTTPPRSPPPISASRWRPAPTSRCEAAGITLMRGDPALVADAIDISRRT